MKYALPLVALLLFADVSQAGFFGRLFARRSCASCGPCQAPAKAGAPKCYRDSRGNLVCPLKAK